jgi:DNA-binding MarR family transcriptional regulator
MRAAIEQFFFAYRGFTSNPDRVLAQRGLGRVHHRVLYFVGRNKGISVSALLGILGVSKQALHAPLRQLVEMGLVEVEPSTEDRRLRCLRLTADGRKLEGQLTGTQLKLLTRAFDSVGPQAEAGWRKVMEALVAE